MRIDLLQADAVSEPHKLFAALREREPVVWSEAHQAWIITDYAGVVEAFRDTTRLSSDRLTPLEQRRSESDRRALALTFQVLRGWMVFHDAPQHAMLRDPVRRSFTARQVSNLKPRIEALADELLATVPIGTPFDFKECFAFPLPAIVIAELMGIPAADREKFKTWSKHLSAIVFGESGNVQQAATAAEGSAEFVEYFRWLITQRTQAPGDDLVSALIAARKTDEGTGLTDMQVVGACTLLLFAGHETTNNFLTNAVLALLQYPDQAQIVQTDPTTTMTSGIDELLRHDGPTKVMIRSVAVDHQRGGHAFRKGETVYLSVIGANRDPAVFADPDRLDLRRATKPPHVGFGQGPHFCLGQALARLEASIALPALFHRFPGLQLTNDELDREPLILTYALKSLPSSFRNKHVLRIPKRLQIVTRRVY